jgi:hypothetical protein
MTERWNGERAMNLRTKVTTRINLAAALVGFTLALAGCDRLKAENAPNALEIVQVQVLSAGDCSVPGFASMLTRSGGTLDVYLPDNSYPPYKLPLLVANNLSSAGGSTAEEMNNITLTHFSIELSASGMSWGSTCPSTFDSETFTTHLAPGASAGHLVEIITSHHAQCLLAALNPQRTDPSPRHVLVTAKIWAKGSHGGTTIQSAPFIYPVDVCTGCLQTDYTDAALIPYRYPADVPLCASLSGTNKYQGGACAAPGQDDTILCCAVTMSINSVATDVAVCPGVFTGTASTTTTP